MKVQTFFTGLIATFGTAWVLVIAYPFFALKDQAAIEWEDKDGNPRQYSPTGQNHWRGAEVYRQENCQTCHTRVIRNSVAGSEVFRSDWAGQKHYDEDGNLLADTRRESHPLDYRDKHYASMGTGRVGPDLINYGMRVAAEVKRANEANEKAIAAGEMKPFTVEELTYLHLYNPRKDVAQSSGEKNWSNCPSNRHLFITKSAAGQGSVRALPVRTKEGSQVVPSADAKALMNFLNASQHDQMLPKSESKGENFAE